MPIRVLLTGNSSMLRRGLRDELGDMRLIEVVGEAGSSDEAVALADRLLPDVLLLDVTIPGAPAPRVLASIGQLCPHVRVICLAAPGDGSRAQATLALGARGWVFTDEGPVALQRAIRAVAAGDTWVSERTMRLLAAADLGMPVVPEVRLTGREMEVLEMVVQGQSDSFIAAELGITRRTVRYHLRNVFDKLGVNSRVEAAVRAVELKIFG